MKAFATIPALLAAVILTDVQWTVMQSVTWVEMILADDRKMEVSVLTVVFDTVSGKTSCNRCRFIERERDSDQEKTLEVLSKSIEVAPINYSKFAYGCSEEKDLVWANRGDQLPGGPPPRSIDHPPRA